MSDSLPTIWEAEPHTFAKHAILKRYLDAWLPILTRQSTGVAVRSKRQILYIDGFAGPGKYLGGEAGSPVIALTAALEHTAKFPTPVRMVFIEQDTERHQILSQTLGPLMERASKSKNVVADHPLQGDCEVVLSNLLNQSEKSGIAFGPALAFLDQFGYSSVPMDLIGRILRFGECEVFTYLNYSHMNRFLSDPTKASAFTRAFGGEEWRECLQLAEGKRLDRLLALYKAALRDPKRGQANYVRSFLMCDTTDRPLYWLIFCTNNLRGLEEMKKAMWTVARGGEFRFSDRDNPEQPMFLDMSIDDNWLAEHLDSALASREMKASDIKEYVLAETPCYKFKEALKKLEKADPARLIVVQAPEGRRSGTYSDQSLDEIVVRFEMQEATPKQISLFD